VGVAECWLPPYQCSYKGIPWYIKQSQHKGIPWYIKQSRHKGIPWYIKQSQHSAIHSYNTAQHTVTTHTVTTQRNTVQNIPLTLTLPHPTTQTKHPIPQSPSYPSILLSLNLSIPPLLPQTSIPFISPRAPLSSLLASYRLRPKLTLK